MSKITALTPVIHGFILELLVKGERPSQVTAKTAIQYGISNRKAERHLAIVKNELAEKVGQRKEEILGVLHERCEKNYQDADDLPTCPETIDLRRKIIGTHADLFGFGRQRDNSGNTTINIALLLPDSIREAIRPTEYTIETQEQGEGDGTQQEQS